MINTAVIHFTDVWHIFPTVRLSLEHIDYGRRSLWAIELVWLAKGFAVEWTT